MNKKNKINEKAIDLENGNLEKGKKIMFFSQKFLISKYKLALI